MMDYRSKILQPGADLPPPLATPLDIGNFTPHLTYDKGVTTV